MKKKKTTLFLREMRGTFLMDLCGVTVNTIKITMARLKSTFLNYNGQGFLDKKILKKSVFYRSMSCHAVSPVFPNSEFSL